MTALAEDDEGGLWIGTLGGLARLKDDRIAVFTERDGLPAGAIHALWWDPAGQLWIGGDGGLARWANGRFTAGAREGFPQLAVSALCVDREGTLWVGTSDQRSVAAVGRSVRPVREQRRTPRGSHHDDLSGSRQRCVGGHECRARAIPGRTIQHADRQGRSRARLLPVVVSGRDRRHLDFLGQGPDALSRRRLQNLHAAGWSARRSDQGHHRRSRGARVRQLASTASRLSMACGFKRWPLPAPAPAARLTTLLADRSGALWVGTTAHGVIVQRGNDTRTYSRADGLGDDYVRTLYEDRAGAVWVGTLRGGASRSRQRPGDHVDDERGPRQQRGRGVLRRRPGHGVDRDARRRAEPVEGRPDRHDRRRHGALQQHRVSDTGRRRRQPVDVLQQGHLSRQPRRSQCRRRRHAPVR